ncbi:glycosyltransferase [Candidatus Chloroploca sp. M-50]|uniref:Glycosyltransferase n=1 Tax=Candidatus Chloroploca mongolica TaxID=2528176 RepID=A0ABS4DCZ3_9CHLR|nr:glycosyltransferase [Candidatus Chloroploca mongolica]MBP1467310.1 glycosyltransferase [Candidatus Chloroploca mongolica]
MARIVFFIDHLRPDGTQQVLKQLVTGLSRRSHTLAVVCLDATWDEELIAILRKAGAEVRIIGRWNMVSGFGTLSLWLWLRHRRFDVAVTLLAVADVVGRPLVRLAGIPRLVSSIRARNLNYPPWKLFLAKTTMPLVDAVIVNSSHTKSWAVNSEGAPQEQTFVIVNGVEVDAYMHPIHREALRASLQLPSEQILIGSVGRLTEQKGQDLLIDALALLKRPDIHLMFVGEGNKETALRGQATRLNLSQQVHFVGYRRDVPQLLGALDLYVHPARFEGMPNALLEAMAAGCPIIASDADGNRELIEEGVSGWLTPVGDGEALARAINTALSNADEAAQRGKMAQARAQTHFSIAAMVEAWESVLLQHYKYNGVKHVFTQ